MKQLARKNEKPIKGVCL